MTSFGGSDDSQAILAERAVAFREHLDLLRTGDRSVTGPLLDVAEDLCREHDRCDAVDIARYYCSLTDAGLAHGLELDRRYERIHAELRAAGGLRDEPWYELRDRVLEGLALFARASADAEDRVPHARALSISARLVADMLEGESAEAPEDPVYVLMTARDGADRSLRIFRAAGMRKPTLEALWARGRLDRLSGDRIAARHRLEECLSEAERIGQPAWSARALEGLLRLAREAGDAQHTGRLLSRLAGVLSPEESWPLTREYAQWILQRDHAEEARVFLARHEAVGEADLVSWRLLSGNAALRSGDAEAARAHFDWLERNDAGESAVLAQASLLLELGRYEDVALELGDGGLSLGFSLRGEAQGHSILGEAELALDRPGRAAQSLGLALELAEHWRHALGTDEHNVFGEWVGLHTVVLLARANAELGRPLEAARVIESFQSRALREGTDPGAFPVSERELLDWANRSELGLVTWAVGADSGVVAHVAPGDAGGAWVASIDRGRRSLATAGRRLREAVLAGRVDRTREIASEIADELVPEALRERLRALGSASGSAAPRLLALAHGPLEAMPIELLFEAEQLALQVLPGLPGAAAGAAPDFASLDGWTLVAGDTGDSELPAARAEVRELEGLLAGARTLTETDGPEVLADALANGRPLHLATHLTDGCACDDTRLAPHALLLPGGGTLCSHEVAREAQASPLVVLSACESGGGSYVDAEGLFGLARAFLEAGTRNVVVTLWPVEDAAAREFALYFHAALRSGAVPSVAAHDARERLREAGAAAADWAAFRVLGRD